MTERLWRKRCADCGSHHWREHCAYGRSRCRDMAARAAEAEHRKAARSTRPEALGGGRKVPVRPALDAEADRG